jgi:site-specific DNA recombinase
MRILAEDDANKTTAGPPVAYESPRVRGGLGRKRAATISRDDNLHATDRLHDPGLSPNAIAYLRVSTEEQADSGLGLDAQRASVAAAAARLGVAVTAVHVDAGRSGALPLSKRPVLLQAIHAVRRGEVLLVAKRDRLGRDSFETAVIERDVKRRGARVVSAAGEGTENDHPDSVFFRGIIDHAAQYEREIGRDRTKRALAAKRAKGERAGTVPFGFRLAVNGVRTHRRGCEVSGIPVEGCACGGRVVQLEEAPVEQRLLADMRARRAAGQSYREIAAALNADGATTRRGTALRFQYIARLLKVSA